MKSPDHTAH